jgi:hypothetical protein
MGATTLFLSVHETHNVLGRINHKFFSESTYINELQQNYILRNNILHMVLVLTHLMSIITFHAFS